MEALIQSLIDEGDLHSTKIIKAFKKIKRGDFLLDEHLQHAAENRAIPISHGQTNSQPLTVAIMLELLQARDNDKVLDVGYGSGWQSALLAELVGTKGKIIAIERIPELCRFGEKNVAKYNYKNVTFVCDDGTKGYKKQAPYDKIIVAAAAEIGIPDILLTQLKVGGRLVIPVGKYEQEMVVVDKIAKDEYKEKRIPGFQFVPLVPKKWGE
ncbi:MAG: protein-L-isoaspartate(D-aspartate) O-methyltransferase [bacterium]|nr:protein-L-isoaspartate(D-aspartate) O-methyltransferase [bacterium]